MQINKFKYAIPALMALVLIPSYAAIPVDLAKQPIFLTALTAAPVSPMQFKETHRALDFKKTLHIRIQQTYAGYPVFGGDSIVHIPHGMKTGANLAAVFSAARTNKGSMNGTAYQGIAADLANTPANVFTPAQSQLVLMKGIEAYQTKSGKRISPMDQQAQLMVYLDDTNKAHWIYKVSFTVDPQQAFVLPEKPVYLMDAQSFQIYDQWNDIETEAAQGGGYGGNKKLGRLVYDGLKDDFAALDITHDATTNTCLLENADVVVLNYMTRNIITFNCTQPDSKHNDVYWDDALDAVNGGYSPANDALYMGKVIKQLYKDWYKLDVLTNPDGSPMLLKMLVHDVQENAYWDGVKMVFGDGKQQFYPLTSLGVGAHEVSHGFTSQHSNLVYSRQPGGMNEAFSDMAAQAAEFYSYGKSSWQIGGEILKAQTGSLRYMDQPSKDCEANQTPGDHCSIDDASQYKPFIDVHYTSGVYNRFFYLLANSEGWDTRKAFDVMVQANANYWTATTNFKKGACGVISAANDLGYDVAAVKAALATVKINYAAC